MGLVVYNTLTRQKEPLHTREPNAVGMYVCGPTVYNHIHIGNARAFIVFDVIRRYLRWRGFGVKFVQNYTDVDDKIINKAREEGLPSHVVAETYAKAFEEVMRALEVASPDVLVKATDHIDAMVEMIRQLINRGYAYESSGNVWFSVEKFSDYGKLSGRTIEDVRAGERVEPDPTKLQPLDFALWKAAKADEPSWESPWGPGRPGWHIECSAMSLRYLGMGFDIHGGGSDLIFPHHENEIAQSEAATGEEPFVRYWLHNGLVHIDEEKMSKSLGNFVLLKDFLGEAPPQVVRLLAITGHYRSDVDFGPEQVAEAKRVYERLDIFLRSAGDGPPDAEPDRSSLDRFTEAMDDDFNTPAALSVIHDVIRQGNILVEESQARAAPLVGALRQMTDVLGITPHGEPRADGLTDELIELLIEVREDARKSKRFDDSDKIRARLAELGVTLEDGSGGTRWRLTI